MENKKKSIISEAYNDYNEIMEAVNQTAKNRLANELPERYNQILTEEKSKNKIAKESDKDNAKKNKESDETDKNLNDESDMKNQVKETNKVESKSVKKTLKEEFESNDSMGSHNEFNDDDITLDEIEAEIAKFSNPDGDDDNLEGEEISGDNENGEEFETSDEEDAETPDEEMYEKLVQLRDELSSVIEDLDSQMGGEENTEGNEDGIETFDDEENFGNDDIEIPDDEQINELLNQEDENEIEEAHGLSYSARRNNTGRHLPNANYLSKGELNQAPMQMQESSKKIKSLINENKELTKKLNLYKTKTNEINETVEKFKVAIGKYRKQLTEMAIFNTNIAHANNILVNESLALTQEDKIRVINEFKSINSIADSKNKYNNILNEMTSAKKSITESVETKLNTIIESSSKHKLDEVIEKTAYKDTEHIDKIKKLIAYVERRKNF